MPLAYVFLKSLEEVNISNWVTVVAKLKSHLQKILYLCAIFSKVKLFHPIVSNINLRQVNWEVTPVRDNLKCEITVMNEYIHICCNFLSMETKITTIPTCNV